MVQKNSKDRPDFAVFHLILIEGALNPMRHGFHALAGVSLVLGAEFAVSTCVRVAL
jgi:hypothetical protein